MKGQRLTTIAQGVFCAVLGVVAAGIGHEPPPVAISPSAPRPEASARGTVRPRPTPAARPAPRRAAIPEPYGPGTRVTLRGRDGSAHEIEYEIAPGDALGALARRFRVPVSRIAIANGIRDPHRVRAGTRLRIPLDLGALDHAIMAQLPPSLRNDPERLRLAPHFDHWARVYDIDPDLLKALGWIESGWRFDAVSHKGAIGIGQLMPDTVDFVTQRLLGRDLDPWTPEQNIRMSARFLRYLLDETDDVDEALAAYYQGLGALRAQGMYRGTRPYVANVHAARRYFTAS
jgi:LysM repeat protein